MKLISILVPVYNEENTIKFFIDQINPVIESFNNKFNFQIIFSDNCSPDKTLYEIKNVISQYKYIKYLKLSKNFGYQASLLAMLNNIESDIYIIIDVDCEDPPYLIKDFIDYYNNDYKYVYGIRKWRNENFKITLARKLFYRITKLAADSDFIIDVAEFSLFDRQIRNAIIKNMSSFPFIRSELAYSGFKRIGIPYRRNDRKIGVSNYNLTTMAKFAIGGFLSTSTILLRLNIYFGLILFIFGCFLIFLQDFSYLYLYFILITNFFIFSVISLSIYLARTYKNGLNRPLFIIEEHSSELIITKYS